MNGDAPKNESPEAAKPAEKPKEPKKSKSAQAAKLNTPRFLWPAGILLAVILFFVVNYFIGAWTHESTDDAFIEAHVISIAPRVSGQIAAVHVLDNQMVQSNELLVEIDPKDLAITAEEKRTASESQSANYRTVLAGAGLMEQKVSTAEASARKAEADVAAKEATARKAAADFARSKELHDQNTISQQEFDAAQTAFKTAQADWDAAKENAALENSKVAESKAQLNTARQQADMALAQWREAQTNVAGAELNLSYTKIFAPAAGRVTRKAVEPGNFVETGQTLMSIVPTDVWVVANYKESQLKKMKPGQSVTVTIDAFDRTFRAHVESIQAGTGARFSLLPPENATGNFVKVVQRVPVKIVFDEPLPADKTIGPGLSVVPKVQTGSVPLAWLWAALAGILLAVAIVFIFHLILNRESKAAKE